jgi:hypothetical protein
MKPPKNALGDWIANAGVSFDYRVLPGSHEGVLVTRCQAVRPADMCYLTSLRSHFFDYPARELGLKTGYGQALFWGGKIAQCFGLDRLSLIGNDPISTNIRSDLQSMEVIDCAQQELELNIQNWVGVRNIVLSQDKKLAKTLRLRNFILVPTRVVYIFDARSGKLAKSSHLDRDRRSLKKSGFDVKIYEPVSQCDLYQIHRLYQQIYIEKHSKLNPDYTHAFFNDMLDDPQMSYLRIYDDNHLVAFALLYKKIDRLVVPAVGHRNINENKGYYRFLFAALANFVEEHKLFLNYSSGAGDFKRKRGGVPMLEFTAIHAPINSKFKQKLIHFIGEKAQAITIEKMIASGA